MATLKSIKKTTQCRPSARVGHRAPEERAWVGHSLTFKPHAISDMQWEALNPKHCSTIGNVGNVGEKGRCAYGPNGWPLKNAFVPQKSYRVLGGRNTDMCSSEAHNSF